MPPAHPCTALQELLMDADASYAFQDTHRCTLQRLDAAQVPDAVRSSRRQLLRHGRDCWQQAGGDNNVDPHKHAEAVVWSYARQAAADPADMPQQEVACVRLVKEGGRSSVVALGRFITTNNTHPASLSAPAPSTAAAAAPPTSAPLVLQCTHCGTALTSLASFQRHALGNKEAVTKADKLALLPQCWSLNNYRKRLAGLIAAAGDEAAAAAAAAAGWGEEGGGHQGVAAHPPAPGLQQEPQQQQQQQQQQGPKLEPPAPMPPTAPPAHQAHPAATPTTSASTPVAAAGGHIGCPALTPQQRVALQVQYAVAAHETWVGEAAVTPGVSAAREALLAAGVQELQGRGMRQEAVDCAFLMKVCGGGAEAAGGGLPAALRQVVYVTTAGEVKGVARLEGGNVTCTHCGTAFIGFHPWERHLTTRTGYAAIRHALLPEARWMGGEFVHALNQRWSKLLKGG